MVKVRCVEVVEQAINSVIAMAKVALGAKGVSEDPHDLAPWLTDWRGIYTGKARAMLSPATLAEVAEIVRAAAAYGVPLVPQGGNTGMVAGATPPADGSALILSLRRMNRIRSIDPDANMAVAEAGVILSTLHDAAQGKGRRFPLSLGAKGSATIGGLVSTNAGGTQVLRFGTMRALVLGIETVLPDGQIYDGLAPLRKDNRGYDLNQLLIGAEGTLGVVTAAALRLVPAIRDRAVGWLAVADPHAALKVLRVMEARSGDAVESFEIVPKDALDLVLRHIPGARAPLMAPHPWLVLIEYVGDVASERLSDLMQSALTMGLAQDAIVAASEAQAEAFWRLRDSISAAERAEGPTIAHDISVPVDAMPAFMTRAARLIEAAYPGVTASAFGHLGDGNVHFHLRAPQGVDGERWRAEIGDAASRMVYDLVTEAGGSISAEHGIGQMKLGELARLASPARLSALRAIKAALDPQGIMNPGKLVPPGHDNAANPCAAPAGTIGERPTSNASFPGETLMASVAPQNPSLPLFYKDLVPISQQEHGSWRYRQADSALFLRTEHAIPLTVEEFAIAQRYYPIVFSAGDAPVPLALMGMNEGVNTFIGDDGKMMQEAYVPAYVRRYPFLLARLKQDSDELSLCVDPTSGAIGAFDDGDAIFDGDQPSEATKSILQFCEQFEQSGQRTGAFMEELKALELIMDGEVTIQTGEDQAPFVYRGFQMVNEEKLRDLRGDQLRKMNQSGMLPLIHAHLFSLSIMREIFGRQMAQGKMPQAQQLT